MKKFVILFACIAVAVLALTGAYVMAVGTWRALNKPREQVLEEQAQERAGDLQKAVQGDLVEGPEGRTAYVVVSRAGDSLILRGTDNKVIVGKALELARQLRPRRVTLFRTDPFGYSYVAHTFLSQVVTNGLVTVKK